MSGSHLLFHTVSSIVPSAAFVLTVVFGMGTGVTQKRITTGPRESTFSHIRQSNRNATPTRMPSHGTRSDFSLRKEVIQPHLPIQLPCYDFTPVIGPAFDGSLFR